MMRAGNRALGGSTLVAGLAAAALCGAALAEPTPMEWLQRMAVAVEQANYSGTVVRIHKGQAQTLRVVHRYEDGTVSEKLESLDGAGREIIRAGDEVHCILPESRMVLVERQINQEGLFGRLAVQPEALDRSYDLTIEDYERVVGRPSVRLAIRPRDHYRFGHRLWLDKASALPLRRQVVGTGGDIVEEMRFAEITIGKPIPASAFRPSMDIEGFTWVRHAEDADTREGVNDTGFEAREVPSGFRLVSAGRERFPDSEGEVAHIVYSDGVASVSVFVEAGRAGAGKLEGASRIGAAYAFGTVVDGHQVTVIGEVPGHTVRMIANSLATAPAGE
jgi:sigma-E factor negative regulatory protein RseB